MTTDPRSAQRSGRIRLLLLAVVFFAPVLLSTLLYYSRAGDLPEDTTNYGELIRPAQPTEALRLRAADGDRDTAGHEDMDGIWSLLLLDTGDCDRVCEERLLMSRQLRVSLGDRRDRLQRILVVPDAAAAEALEARLRLAHPDLLIRLDDGGSAATFFGRPEAGVLHLTDPLGNWLMRYAPDATPKGMRKDISRLLRVSQIG